MGRYRRTGNSVALWLIVVIGGAILVLCGGGGAVAAFVLWKAKPGAVTGGQKKTYTRDEFRKLVVGKTEAEVIAAVGRPDGTQNYGTPFWFYHGVTVDEVSGKTDTSAQLVFKGGVVERVGF